MKKLFLKPVDDRTRQEIDNFLKGIEVALDALNLSGSFNYVYRYEMDLFVITTTLFDSIHDAIGTRYHNFIAKESN
jgi:hypothetical protein